jgi:ankyrin repeat protein
MQYICVKESLFRFFLDFIQEVNMCLKNSAKSRSISAVKTLAFFSVLLFLGHSAFAFEPLFDTRIDYRAEIDPYSVFCADLDGDTDLDLAVANLASDNVSILKNNGDGTFESAVNYGAGDAPFSVFCADLDGDTDLDLAVANENSDNVSILFNRSITTDVPDGEDLYQRPQEYWLSQNYPNPFNLSTKIEFTLPKSGFVSLNIYNILGRKVRTLVSGHSTSGYKSVLWDGKDDSGKEVASGIYFYRLRGGDFSETKKLVLLK